MITGNIKKVKALACIAAIKSSLAIQTNMLVIPQPGHLRPVRACIGQGMPIPVMLTNSK